MQSHENFETFYVKFLECHSIPLFQSNDRPVGPWHHYMSYTVHYINNSWEYQTRVLETFFISEDHTGDKITDALKDTWNLAEKIKPVSQPIMALMLSRQLKI